MTVSGLASSRPVYVRIYGHCEVRLWGLSSEERLRRQVQSLPPATVLETGTEPAAGSTVVLLRADWLYDQRTLQDLLKAPGTLLRVGENGAGAVVAAHVAAERVAEVEPLLGRKVRELPPGLEVKTPASLSSAYVQKLLKAERPIVSRIQPDKKALLERYLFDGSYKGITDLVTKWVWPAPARMVVRVCVALGIRPNGVTLTSLVLVFAVLWLFDHAWFASGLLLAWIMTFLDTVDGKLARVTLDSSPLGHALDKGIDLIHPPLWYIAWGAGAIHATLSDAPPWLMVNSVIILGGYIGGRLLEGAFDFYLGKFPIYSWRPLDSFARLIIARRNPNLLLLSAAWIAGRPEVGLTAVAGWTVISTIFLVFRVAVAAYRRMNHGPLKSWLQQSATESTPSFASRTFASSAPSLAQALESSG